MAESDLISAAVYRRALGEAVSRRREALGMSQRSFARMSGVAPNHFREIEAGERDLRIATVLKLAAAFGMAPSELLEEAEALLDGPARPR